MLVQNMFSDFIINCYSRPSIHSLPFQKLQHHGTASSIVSNMLPPPGTIFPGPFTLPDKFTTPLNIYIPRIQPKTPSNQTRKLSL